MDPIEKLIRQNAAEIVKEYTGNISGDEKRRIKYDCKHRTPYEYIHRRKGRRAKIKKI